MGRERRLVHRSLALTVPSSCRCPLVVVTDRGQSPAGLEHVLSNRFIFKTGCTILALVIADRVAHADPIPVIAIHREVGLAAEGQFTNYKENFSAKTSPGLHDRETGGTPGFEFKAEDMFDLGPIKHIFASVLFRYNNGTTKYNGAFQNSNAPLFSTDGLETKDVRAELGKGFLFGDRLLITPAFQFAYRDYNRGLNTYQEEYRQFAVGAAVHGDFSLTRRLILSARLGWAETIDPRMTATGQSVRINRRSYPLDPIDFSLGERPVWQAGTSLDYRLLRHVHLYGGVDFQRFGYSQGKALATAQGHSGHSRYTEPDSWTQTVVLTTGLAWSF